jgi:hypothetical protein
VGIGTTSTLISFPIAKNNGLVASVFVFDTVRFNFNFVEFYFYSLKIVSLKSSLLILLY